MSTCGMTHPRVRRLARPEALLAAVIVVVAIAVGFEAGRVTAPSEPVAVPAPATAFVPSTPGWRYELNRAIDVRLAPFEVHTPAWHGHLNDATNALLGTEAVR